VSEVLACVDFSDATDAVVREGARLALTADNRLHLIHVAAAESELAGYDKGPIAVHTRDDRADELLTEHDSMRELAERVRSDASFPDLEVVPIMTMGPTVAKILDEADHIDAGVIVVGSHGHGGLHHLLLGSVSEGLIKHSRRPVVVVPVAQR
jgi:nucleotide-binding universal stress UspA family protein